MYSCLLPVQKLPRPVFIPSSTSFVLFPKLFSWPCSCLLMACLRFLLISLSIVSPVPQHSCTHLSDCKWIELLEKGAGELATLFFLQQNLYFTLRSMSLLKHMASITGPLFPVSASFLLPTPCPSLAALSAGSGNPASIAHSPELVPPFLNLRGYEPSK